MDIKLIFNKLCLKQKSLLFILFLISIMLFTLYYQHRVSYKNYLYLLNDSYKSSLDNQYKNFLSNLALNYSNIKIHFQDEETYTYLSTKQNSKLEQKLNTSLQILQKNNLYLFDIMLYPFRLEWSPLRILNERYPRFPDSSSLVLVMAN